MRRGTDFISKWGTRSRPGPHVSAYPRNRLTNEGMQPPDERTQCDVQACLAHHIGALRPGGGPSLEFDASLLGASMAFCSHITWDNLRIHRAGIVVLGLTMDYLSY
jgi:hypothetical protein